MTKDTLQMIGIVALFATIFYLANNQKKEKNDK
jgi:hypothetical protein